MLYHKIAIDNSFCNKLYPCAPIVRLVIFMLSRVIAGVLFLIKIESLFHGYLHHMPPIKSDICGQLLRYADLVPVVYFHHHVHWALYSNLDQPFCMSQQVVTCTVGPAIRNQDFSVSRVVIIG